MLLYRFLAALVLIVYAPIAWIRSLAGGRRLGDVRGRLGKGDYPDLSGGIWVHAVSVGEVAVARNLLEAVRRRAPGTRLGLSVTTDAGRELAGRMFRDRVPIFAFPFDLASAIDSALDGVHPGIVLLTETEIWPLFLERAAARGVGVALVNGRISRASFARYRRVKTFFARTLSRIQLFAMQSAEDAERIAVLGAAPERIHVTGNLKYDLPSVSAPFADGDRLRQAAAGRPIFIAASTGEGEEAVLLKAWRPFADRAMLAVAPRRPERFDEVERLIRDQGFEPIRRSSNTDVDVSTSAGDPVDPVYLLDTIGELAALYREGSLAFVGGSLVDKGGHNPIEAWAAGIPVLTGPSVDNFREIVDRGERGGFLERLSGAQQLESRWKAWLADPAAFAARGERARQFVTDNRGAAEATARLVLPLLESRRLSMRTVS